MCRVRGINIKNCADYFFDESINIKNIGSNNIKIDKKSCKSILICCIGYVTPNIVTSLHFIINNTNEYIDTKVMEINI